MTSYETAFLADIHEHSADDGTRLIYADWLDEHGESDQAEFIRVQIQRTRFPADRALAARETELLHEHEESWRSRLPSLEGVTWAEFSRGFVESVFVASAEVFERHAAAIFAAAPVRRMQIGELDAAATRRLARSPFLTRLSELNLGNNPEMGRGIHALAESPYVVNLASLLLHYNDLGDDASGVASSPYLGQLTELYLSGNRLTDPVVETLARSLTLPRLAELDLRDNQVGDTGAQSLAYHGLRGSLATLWLVNNQIGEAGAWALAGTPYLPRLSQLYLNYNPIGDEGAVAFAVSPHHPLLRDLDLRACGLGDLGGSSLAESPHLEHLELLWVGGNRFRGATLQQLRRRFGDRLRV